MILDLYQKDLKSFLQFYENNHICPYFFYSKLNCQKYIENYLQNYDITNDYEFIYFLRRLIKTLVGELDSHTMVRTRYEYQPLPLQLTVERDKVVVNNTTNEYKKYKSKRVIAINYVDVDKLLIEAANAISFSTENYRRFITGHFLSCLDPLLTLPSMRNAKRILYQFDDGTSTTIANPKNSLVIFPRRENYSLKLEADSLTLVYSSSSDPDKMRQTVREINRFFDSQPINEFILDLRGNQGGNSEIINPLIDSLNTKQNIKKTIIVDRAVQSAGLFAIQKMKKLGASIKGEEIGSSMNHFGNNQRLELPSSRFLAIVATRYFYLNDSEEFCTVRNREKFSRLNKKYLQPYLLKLDYSF